MTHPGPRARATGAGAVSSWLRRSVVRRPGARTVPAAVLDGTELIHLGGGESIACPGVGALPMAQSSRRLGLGSPSLALPPARVHVLRDVLLYPGSRTVTDQSGRLVAESLMSDMNGAVGPNVAELSSDPVELEGNVALFRSPWRPYFHTLIDHLPRAALLGQPAIRRLGPVTLVHDGPLSPVEAHLLSRLLPPQVCLLQVEPGTAIRPERLLLPGYVTRPSAGAIPSWYRRWIDQEAQRQTVADTALPGRRIFIDRVNSPRRVVNRAEIEPVLERYGIDVVEPSEYSPSVQIEMFRRAEVIIGVTGSGLANAVFSRAAHIVELLPGEDLLPHFFYLAAAKGLPYSYVPAPPDRLRLNTLARLRRDVVVDAAALDAVLGERLAT